LESKVIPEQEDYIFMVSLSVSNTLDIINSLDTPQV